MELTLDQALQKGIEAHRAGKTQEADRYYTAILKANPKHSDANHNMGVLAVGIGKVEQALPFFKTALESNNPVDVVSTSLYMIADRLYNFGREGLIKNEKGEIPEGYLVAAFAQVEIIHGAFNLLSCNTDAFYKATITSKILPPMFPEKHKKIKDSIDEFIHNKQIQIGVIQPLSVFLSFLLYDKKPNPKFIVNFIDGNVCEILVKVLTGKPNEAVEMCEMFKFKNEKKSIDEEKKADKSSPDNSSSSFRPFGKKDIP